MAEAARKRMDALGKDATEERLETAMRGSTAPAATPESMLKKLLADPKFDNDRVERDFVSKFGQAAFDKASQ